MRFLLGPLVSMLVAGELASASVNVRVRVRQQQVMEEWSTLLPAFDHSFRESGSGHAIVTMDLEKYLLAVVPSEMPAGWPLEALKAQAVASRSFALSMREENWRRRGFDLGTSVLDQVFDPQKFLSLASSLQVKVQEAIRATRGEILRGPDGSVLKSFFHADCGGALEPAESVWGRGGPREVHSGARCLAREGVRWSAVVETKELSRMLHRAKLMPQGAVLRVIEVSRRRGSGRVGEVTLILAGQEPIRITGERLRAVLGYGRLKSTLFHVSRQGDAFEFVGRGFGHGVGMCQMGSLALAKLGRSYQEILLEYFPDATLGALRASIAARSSGKGL